MKHKQVKKENSKLNIPQAAENINLNKINQSLLKQFLAAAVMDLAMYSPEIMAATGLLSSDQERYLDQVNETGEILSTIDNQTGRQSYVAQLITDNPQLIETLVNPVMRTVRASVSPIIKAGQSAVTNGYDAYEKAMQTFASGVAKTGVMQTQAHSES